MNALKKTFWIYVFSLCTCLSLCAGIEETSFFRNDQSQATAYISTPDNCEAFPLVVYIDGSPMQSVKNNFSFLSLLFNQKNIGVVAIEKRGITKDNVNEEEFLTYDCYENRLLDYVQLVSELNTMIGNWNGQLIFIGSSEGGKIAPKLTLHFADKTMGTIVIGSGGGLPFGEEIKYQIKQLFKENDERELGESIDAMYTTILEQPDSLEKYYDKTYKWFASYLRYNLLEDLLQIHSPILMIHGALDKNIPVESADIVQINFDLQKKENLTYLRYEDLGHSIAKRIDIFMVLLNFTSDHFSSEAVVGF